MVHLYKAKYKLNLIQGFKLSMSWLEQVCPQGEGTSQQLKDLTHCRRLHPHRVIDRPLVEKTILRSLDFRKSLPRSLWCSSSLLFPSRTHDSNGGRNTCIRGTGVGTWQILFLQAWVFFRILVYRNIWSWTSSPSQALTMGSSRGQHHLGVRSADLGEGVAVALASLTSSLWY